MVLCLGTEALSSSLSLDWSDYQQVHADRRNLCMHLFAVPLFAISFPATVVLLAQADLILATVSLMAAVGSMVFQGIGHGKESIPPKPFKGPLDFIKRWFSEQYFTFPLFVVSGRWWRQYQTADH